MAREAHPVEHDMAVVRELGAEVTVRHEGSVLAEGSIDAAQNHPRVIEVCLRRRTLLTIDAIGLAYGSSQIMRRVSLKAVEGEVTGLLGRNGVGKTSLLRAIFGLQSIRAGRIDWEGRRMDTLPTDLGMALPPWFGSMLYRVGIGFSPR